MVVAWVAITDCITSLPSASTTATEMVLWWTSRTIYLMLSIGYSFREVGYCSAQQPNPTAKGAPFYNAWPSLPDPDRTGGAPSFSPALGERVGKSSGRIPQSIPTLSLRDKGGAPQV